MLRREFASWCVVDFVAGSSAVEITSSCHQQDSKLHLAHVVCGAISGFVEPVFVALAESVEQDDLQIDVGRDTMMGCKDISGEPVQLEGLEDFQQGRTLIHWSHAVVSLCYQRKHQ